MITQNYVGRVYGRFEVWLRQPSKTVTINNKFVMHFQPPKSKVQKGQSVYLDENGLNISGPSMCMGCKIIKIKETIVMNAFIANG